MDRRQMQRELADLLGSTNLPELPVGMTNQKLLANHHGAARMLYPKVDFCCRTCIHPILSACGLADLR